jgi:hypothetical protein
MEDNTMNSWIITATVEIPDGPTTGGQAELELAERYTDTLPAAAACGGDGRVTVDYAVDAATIDDAFTTARQLLKVPAGWRLVELRVRTEAELVAELARPALPALAGISEAAEMLGVSRQRAHVLAASADFPTAVAHLAAGPVYLEASVRAFADRPRTSGRPRKAPAAPAAPNEPRKRVAKASPRPARTGKKATTSRS